MWLTGNKIIQSVLNKEIKIEPFHFENVNPNSYNYTIFPIIKRIKNDVIDLKEEDEYEEIVMDEKGYILQPGECYLGCTNEIFHSDIFASLVTGRSSIGRKFITNHITAGLVDQGFEGRITLEITVVKPTRIYPNVPFGQIYWFETVGEPLLYKGKYQKQNTPQISEIKMDFLKKIKQKKLYVVPEMVSDELEFENSFYCNEHKEIKHSMKINPDFYHKMNEIFAKENIDRIEITGGGDPLSFISINELLNYLKSKNKRIKIYTKGKDMKAIPFVDEINIIVPINGDVSEVKNKILFYKKYCDKIRVCIPMVLGFSSSSEEQTNLVKEFSLLCDEIVFRLVSLKFNDSTVQSKNHGVINHEKVKYDIMEFDNPTNLPLIFNYKGELLDEIK